MFLSYSRMDKRGAFLLKEIIEILVAVFIIVIMIIAIQRFASTYLGDKENMQAKGTLDGIIQVLNKINESESKEYFLTAPANWHIVAFEHNQNINEENEKFEKPKEMFGKTIICICEKKKCKSSICRIIKIPLRQNEKQANIKIEVSEIWFTNLRDYYNLSYQKLISKTELSESEKEELELNIQKTESLDDLIKKSAQMHYSEVSAYFANADNFAQYLKAIIWQESRGNNETLGICGEVGLMQLMPDTARELGLNVINYAAVNVEGCSQAFECNSQSREKCSKVEDERFMPEKNIEAGTKYIIKLIKQFNDKELALAAYNAGPGNVQKYCGSTLASCSQGFAGRKYAEKVLAYYYEMAQ